MSVNLNDLLNKIKTQDPTQIPFHQAVEEVFLSLHPFLEKNKKYTEFSLLERIVEPERVIMFRVPWLDDQGNVRVNRGFRVQMSSAIGPYKGGLRFHPTVDLGVLKFLAFEQVFKNALTSLPMGGGKGGADFDPKGKSDIEVMSFCHSFMNELFRHIGQFTDVPAGDIGVGGREIGFLYGQYKKIKNEFTSVLTGKGMSYGGSLIRPEATGFGLIYFVISMLKTKGEILAGKKVLLSGSGNVAQYAAKKLIQENAIVLTISDSNGYVYFPKGMTENQLEALFDLKNNRRERLSIYAKEQSLAYFNNEKPWSVPCDIALPCATQNELDQKDAELLVKNGCFCVAEGANMPSTLEAVEDVFLKEKILYAPGKASNAGGVATSGLEMSQNSIRFNWSEKEVDDKLKNIMEKIHDSCISYGKQGDYINYVDGANIAGFIKVADAILEQGIV